jgi:hypothetical protein
MIVTIKKGSNYSSGISVSGMHMGKTEMSFKVRMDYSGLLLPDNSTCVGDFNKLFGWSHGMHHTNSFRIAWRAIDPVTVNEQKVGTKYRIAAYCYQNGVRYIKGFSTILPDQSVDMFIKREGNIVTFGCNNNTTTYTYNGPTGWGYNLNPYYGGNCPAPQTINIELL